MYGHEWGCGMLSYNCLNVSKWGDGLYKEGKCLLNLLRSDTHNKPFPFCANSWVHIWHLKTKSTVHAYICTQPLCIPHSNINSYGQGCKRRCRGRFWWSVFICSISRSSFWEEQEPCWGRHMRAEGTSFSFLFISSLCPSTHPHPSLLFPAPHKDSIQEQRRVVDV